MTQGEFVDKLTEKGQINKKLASESIDMISAPWQMGWSPVRKSLSRGLANSQKWSGEKGTGLSA